MSSPHGLINDNKEYLRVASPEKVPELLAPGFTAKRMQCRHCIRFRSPPFQRRNRVGDAGQGHRPTVRSNHRRSSLTVPVAVAPSPHLRRADPLMETVVRLVQRGPRVTDIRQYWLRIS